MTYEIAGAQWTVIPGYKSAGVFDRDGQLVADVFGSGGGSAEANAHLIAAAPDLLATLERMVWHADFWVTMGVNFDGEILGAARSAIAKARNEGIHEDAGQD